MTVQIFLSIFVGTICVIAGVYYAVSAARGVSADRLSIIWLAVLVALVGASDILEALAVLAEAP